MSLGQIKYDLEVISHSKFDVISLVLSDQIIRCFTISHSEFIHIL